jgi:hypothetical protein
MEHLVVRPLSSLPGQVYCNKKADENQPQEEISYKNRPLYLTINFWMDSNSENIKTYTKYDRLKKLSEIVSIQKLIV